MTNDKENKVEPGQEIKGAVKESLGRTLHNPGLEAEGAAEKAELEKAAAKKPAPDAAT